MNELVKLKAFYILTTFVAICLVCIGIHNKAYQAVAPPIHDPISYYSKSQIVWDAIVHSHWKSAFDQFAMRPPGTALILYPFGFVPSIQSFLFRSTFAPVCIWALALMVIILPKIRNLKEMLAGVALTAGLLALPVFYHFEFPIATERAFGISLQWGLVDVLQSSVGALAVGFLYTGVRKSIKPMLLIAWLLGAYTFFIKPSGTLVMGCLFLIYSAESLISWMNRGKVTKKDIIICIGFLIVGISINAVSIWLAFWGGYLSRDVIHTAQTASKILIQSVHPPILSQLELMVWPVFGYWWFIPIAITTLKVASLSVHSLLKWRFSDLGLRFVICLLIIFLSLYWLVTMAGQEHRYLFPFIFVIMCWLIVPTLFEWMISLGSRVRYMAIAYCLVPLICIITLLNIQQGKVSSGIERFFGFNLDTGQYRDEVKIGRYLLQQALKKERQITIYSIGNYRVGAVEMIDWVNSIENPLEPHHFNTYRVNDWIHPGIKMKQLLSCDYYIIEKSYLDQVPSVQKDAKRWQDEESFLVNFIKSLTQQPDSPIRLIQDGPVSLYKVQNREKYVAACNDWVANHKWSDDFWVRNSYERGDLEMPGLQVVDPKVVDDLLSKTASVLPVIDFGHKMTLLALLSHTENDSLKSGEALLTFLFRADQVISSKYAIFIHLMDKDKQVIFQHDFQIDPDGGIISKGTHWKSVVQIPENELTKTFFIGFGAYIPSKEETFLQSNYKQSDWNGNRVILPLK
jgi:hypothetical protein